MGDNEQAIFDLYARRNPNDLYRMGDQAFAGLAFIPSLRNVEEISREAEGLLAGTDDPVETGILHHILRSLEFTEPYHPLSEVLWGIFSHLVMDGVNPDVLERYFRESMEVLRESEDLLAKTWPPVVRVRTWQNASGCLGILASVKEQLEKEGGAEGALVALGELSGMAEAIRDDFACPGVDEGDFAHVFPYLQKERVHVGRAGLYPHILTDLYGFYESPEEVDELAAGWLDAELPLMASARSALAELYGIDDDHEAVTEAMKERTNLERGGILEFMRGFRSVLQPLVEETTVRISPRYRTEIVETPEYLVNFIPTAAMSPFKALSDEPYNYFFVTTDEKRSPPVGMADLFQLIIHEEYGHCVNFSNSALRFGARPGRLELLPSSLSLPISDGISFFRELESLWLLDSILERVDGGAGLSAREKDLVAFVSEREPFARFVAEVRFVVYQWRVVRFLRAMADVRVNMHTTDYASFVEWAVERTGLEPRLIHDQLFIFQGMVGYAPSYSIGGESLRRMQERLGKEGVEPIDFNTRACSMGFSPRAHFEKKLEDDLLGGSGA